jgi:rhamnosyltransferase subunit B
MQTPIHYLFASVGTMGDALPYLALAEELRERGHRVSFFCNEEHRARIERTGVEFVSAGPNLQYEQTMQNPNLWHSIKGMGVLWRGLMLPSIEPLYATIKRLMSSTQALRVVAAPHMLGGRLAQEHLGADLISVYTASSMLRTCIAPTTIAHTYWPKGTPRWILRMLWNRLDHYKLEPMARKHLRQVCERLRVPPPPSEQSLFGQWIHSTRQGITLYPSWFCSVPADVAAPVVSGDFPVLVPTDATPTSSLQEELCTYLNNGAAPIVVSLGSGMLHAANLYSRWQQAIVEAGMRGILISADCKQLPKTAHPDILHLSFAPFTQLLPHCRALIHHGGIGSCIQALSAGIPQVIQPHAHDQYENARCATALGAAVSIPRNASVSDMMQLLRKLMKPTFSLRAQQIKPLVQTNGISYVCDLLEA